MGNLKHKLWIYFIPLLFIPNFLEFEGNTPFGQLELMDLMIFPFLALLLLSPANQVKQYYREPYKYIFIFISFSFIGLTLMPLRYHYQNEDKILFCVLKLAKFFLYILVGLSISKRINAKNISLFFKSLIISSIMIGSSITYLDFSGGNINHDRIYSAANVISATCSILIAFFTPFLLFKTSIKVNKSTILFCVFILLIGILLSDGRGGIVAVLVTFLYLFYKKVNNVKIWLSTFSGIAFLFFSYFSLDSFKADVDRTLFPDDEQLRHFEKYNMGAGGIDDGKRINGFLHEYPLVINTPFIGTGFFHRGGESGLLSSGSHNFFLQIILETGFIGFYFIYKWFSSVWKQSNLIRNNDLSLSIAIKMVIIAAIISGMTGEYFYAGEALMTFLLLYAPLGALSEAFTKTI